MKMPPWRSWAHHAVVLWVVPAATVSCLMTVAILLWVTPRSLPVAAAPDIVPDTVAPPVGFGSEPAAPSQDMLVDARDWADSLPVPAWILDPDRFGRRYLPAGSGASTSPASASSGSGFSASAPSPLLVVRLQGRQVVLDDIGLGGTAVTPAVLRLSPHYRMLDECSERVSIESAVAGSEATRARAMLGTGRGEWLFGIAAPATVCQTIAQRGWPKRAPSRDERKIVERTLQAAGGSATGGHSFEGRDVRDFAASTGGDVRILWGVARRLDGTQIAPPPPAPQVAFIIIGKEGSWRLAWSRSVEEPGARLGLAGAFDVDGDRVAEGLFVVRLGQAARLLRVGPGEGGDWVVVENRELPPLPR
jgi:hypothetical protein